MTSIVTASDDAVGGIVGLLDSGKVMYNWAYTVVSGDPEFKGPIVGKIQPGSKIPPVKYTVKYNKYLAGVIPTEIYEGYEDNEEHAPEALTDSEMNPVTVTESETPATTTPESTPPATNDEKTSNETTTIESGDKTVTSGDVSSGDKSSGDSGGGGCNAGFGLIILGAGLILKRSR